MRRHWQTIGGPSPGWFGRISANHVKTVNGSSAAYDRRMPSSLQHVPKVLQVVLSLHPGGTERLVVEIVRRLRSELSMAVCCLDDEGSWGKELRLEGIDIVALNRGPNFRPLLGHKIARFAAANNIDVAHCHHYSPFVYSSIARVWRPRMQVIFTEHGRLSDAPPSTKRRLANRILSRAP